MTRRLSKSVIHVFLICLALQAGGTSAWAASAEKKDSHSPKTDAHGEEILLPPDQRKPGDKGYVPPHSTNMPMLLIPAMVNGRRSHYIFVSYRLVMYSELQVDAVNQKIAWLHDAFLREVFKTSPVDPDNFNRPDEARIEKRFREIAKDVLHDDVVKAVYFSESRSEIEPVKHEPPAIVRRRARESSKDGH